MSPGVTSDVFVNTSSNQLSILKLHDDGSNWVDYEVKTLIALGSRGLIKHVEGTVRRPTPYPIEDGIPVSKPGKPATDEEMEAKEEKIEEFE